MKKLKIGCHFININHTEKFQITDPTKVWLSSFLSVDRNRISALAIMKNWNGCHFINILIVWKNFKLLIPQSLALQFSGCQWKQNISVGHYEKIEKWLPFHKYQSYGKISNYWTPPPPKFGSPVFQVLTETKYQHQPLWKNLPILGSVSSFMCDYA